MSLIPSATTTVNKWIWAFTGQVAHAETAYIAISKAKHYGGMRAAIIAIVIGVGAAAFKEFYWDYHYEDAATRGSSLLDFSMYCLGMTLGFFL